MAQSRERALKPPTEPPTEPPAARPLAQCIPMKPETAEQLRLARAMLAATKVRNVLKPGGGRPIDLKAYLMRPGDQSPSGV